MSSESSLGRGVAMILVAGISLGLVHNWLGLWSHPPRGISWRASSVSLPTLEGLALPDTTARATQPAAVSASPESLSPKTEPTPSPARHTAATAAPKTPSRAPVPEAGTHSAPAAEPSPTATAPVTTGSAARLPYVPDLDRPVETKLATVKQFFDARAALFLDARDASDYEAGHIPGAIRMTQSDALSGPEKLKALPVAGRPIIAYCEGGECEASLELARALVDSGFRKVLVYTGGFPEWSAAGYPVERGKGGP